MTNSKSKSEAPARSVTCPACDSEITGYEHGGYLWPVWMKKENCLEFPPHGPRLFNIDLDKCWICACKAGESWHR